MTPIISFACRVLFGTRATILDLEGTFAHLEATGRSLVRWGDGETEIAQGRGIYNQASEPKLAAYLRQILQQKRDDLLIGVPAEPMQVSLRELLTKKRLWLRTRLLWARHIRGNGTYADAFVFRRDPAAAMAVVERFVDGKAFVVIASGDREDERLFEKSAIPRRWVGLPRENAFSALEHIIGEIRAASRDLAQGRPLREGVVLLAAGPTAKALVCELSGTLRCCDVGALFDFQRKPAKVVWPS